MATTKIVDFTNTKEGGNFNKARIPSGDYLAKVVKVEDSKSKKDDVFQYLFTIQLVKRASSKLPFYCKLEEGQLWKLRNLAVACGLTVPKKKLNFNPNKCVGKLIGVTIDDAEYEGKLQSEVGAVFPASELDGGPEDSDVADDDDVADDEETEDEADDTEEEADEGDRFDAMDRNELKVYIRTQDATAAFKKSESDDDLRSRARALEAAESEDDEEDEPEPPKPTARKKTAAKKPAPAVEDDEDLDELDIDDL